MRKQFCSKVKASTVASLIAFACVGCDGTPSPETTDQVSTLTEEIRSGREIAQAECASCHAIGRDGESPHPDAKAFRFFSEKYPVSELAEALAQGIYVGHPDMPVFRFEPDEVDRLIDYIKGVQEPKDI